MDSYISDWCHYNKPVVCVIWANSTVHLNKRYTKVKHALWSCTSSSHNISDQRARAENLNDVVVEISLTPDVKKHMAKLRRKKNVVAKPVKTCV